MSTKPARSEASCGHVHLAVSTVAYLGLGATKAKGLQLAQSPLVVYCAVAHSCPLGLSNHAGKYTTSKFPYHLHPELKPTCLREMSQLNHGHALWSVALRYLVDPT